MTQRGTACANAAAMMQRTALVGSFAICLTISSLAAAQPKPDEGMPHVAPGSPAALFAERGQLAIMGEAGALFTHTSVSGGGSTTSIVFRPAIDYFIIDHLSLGAFAGVGYTSAAGGSTTTYAIGPRVGYDIPFSERFSLWPKVGLSFNSATVKIDATDIGPIRTPSSSASNTALALNLYVPLVFHSHHYFAGFGPSLDLDLSGSPKSSTIAARLVVGGWVF